MKPTVTSLNGRSRPRSQRTKETLLHRNAYGSDWAAARNWCNRWLHDSRRVMHAMSNSGPRICPTRHLRWKGDHSAVTGEESAEPACRTASRVATVPSRQPFAPLFHTLRGMNATFPRTPTPPAVSCRPLPGLLSVGGGSCRMYLGEEPSWPFSISESLLVWTCSPIKSVKLWAESPNKGQGGRR